MESQWGAALERAWMSVQVPLASVAVWSWGWPLVWGLRWGISARPVGWGLRWGISARALAGLWRLDTLKRSAPGLCPLGARRRSTVGCDTPFRVGRSVASRSSFRPPAVRPGACRSSACKRWDCGSSRWIDTSFYHTSTESDAAPFASQHRTSTIVRVRSWSQAHF